MAVKVFDTEKRKPKLHSLIDMSFILLLFFLATSMIVQLKETEQKLAIPTPENVPGRAQILIQLISENRVFFLDESASKVAQNIFTSYGFYSKQQQIKMVVDHFRDNNIISGSELADRIKKLQSEAENRPQAQYFVLIRCPDELPYYHVIDVMQALSGLPNVNYGCVGGSLDEILSSDNIYVQDGRVNGGVQRNLVIEF